MNNYLEENKDAENQLENIPEENRISIFFGKIFNKNPESCKYKCLYYFYLSLKPINNFSGYIEKNIGRTNSKYCTVLSFFNKRFNWKYYLEENKDVGRKKKYNSEKGAIIHYNKYGKMENRKAKYIYSKEKLSKFYENNLDKKWIIFEANPLARYTVSNMTDENTYFKVCINSVYLEDKCKFLDYQEKRWDEILNKTGIEVLPWRKSGENIVIILNSCMKCGYAIKNENINIWLNNVIKKIRSSGCKRRIIVRFKCKVSEIYKKKSNRYKLSFHQKCGGEFTCFDPLGNFDFDSSGSCDIPKLLLNCWAAVVHSTSAAVICFIKGIPIFSTSKNSIAYQYGNNDLNNIENPILFNRNLLLKDIARQIWSLEEIKNGTLWKEIKNLEENDIEENQLEENQLEENDIELY